MAPPAWATTNLSERLMAERATLRGVEERRDEKVGRVECVACRARVMSHEKRIPPPKTTLLCPLPSTALAAAHKQ